MELYYKLIDVIAPVFFVIGIGFYLGKKDLKLNTDFITTFAGNVGTPAMIFYTITTTGVTLGASNTGGPYSINGYYPLYSRETLAQDAGNSTAHEHVFFGKTFYMPNGLILGTTYFHGNYNGTLTSPEYTATTTTVSSQNTTIPTTINSSTSTTGDSY